jgi:hypothetical protein
MRNTSERNAYGVGPVWLFRAIRSHPQDVQPTNAPLVNARLPYGGSAQRAAKSNRAVPRHIARALTTTGDPSVSQHGSTEHRGTAS